MKSELGRRSRHRLLRGLIAALIALAWGFPIAALAVPVSYYEDLVGGNISGTLNGVPFANSYLFLSFTGDTATTIPFSITGASGYENLTGSATFQILDANFNTIGAGNFLPDAGIFISVDNTNGGIGFGSFGLPPWDPNFPPPTVIYPGAVLVPCNVTPNVVTYDLQSDAFFADYQLGCVGFPGTCQPGLPLSTDQGVLTVDQITVGSGYFQTQTSPVTAMSALKASVAVSASPAAPAGGTPLNHFQVKASVSLDNSRGGVDPLTEPVTLQLAHYRVTIPAGSFHGSRQSGYHFHGDIHGVALHVSLTPDSSGGYSVEADGAGAAVPPLANPLYVRLTLGHHAGRTMVNVARP